MRQDGFIGTVALVHSGELVDGGVAEGYYVGGFFIVVAVVLLGAIDADFFVLV